MANVLIIKDADFSANAVEKINPYAPAVNIHIAVGGTVTLTASGSMNIYYTTNGVDPTTSSTTYTVPFTVAAGTTVKAIAEYTAGISDVSSVIFNAGGASILYKQNYTLGFATQSSTTLTEIAMTGYGISDFIPVPPHADLNVNYGANVQTMGMWDEYYKFKIVEYDENKQITVSTEVRTNEKGTPGAAVGNNCIWSIRDGQYNIDYKNIPTQQGTHYIRIVVKLDTSANVVDKDNNNNVLFQYIPDNS